MQKQLMLAAMATIISAMAWTACQKDNLPTPKAPLSNSSLDVTERDGGQGEMETVSKTLQKEIVNFKITLDEWRKNANTSQTMSAAAATEQIESVWNYYVGESTDMFAEDYHFNDFVLVNSSSGTWNGTQIATLFEDIKARIVYHYGTISGTNKGIRLIDLSEPVIEGGSTKIYIYINAGKTRVNQPNQVNPPDTRWSPIFGPVAPCTGDAPKIIGEVVNSQLGFYLKNDIPNAAGNPLVKPNTLVLNPRQVRVNNVAFEPPLPGGIVICDGYTYFNFPTNTTEADPFPTRGQYKIHFDIGFGVPANEHCFNISKLLNYCIDNQSVGNQIRTECVITKPGLALHRLVATFVNSNTSSTTGTGGVILNFQDHPTIFYYGRVLSFIAGPDAPTDIAPDQV